MKFRLRHLALALVSVLPSSVLYAQDGDGGGAAAAASSAAAVSTPAASSAAAAPAAGSSSDGGAAAGGASVTTPALDAPSAGLTPNDGESDSDFLTRVMTAKSGLPATEGEEGQQPAKKEGEPGEEGGEGAEGEDDDFGGDDKPGEGGDGGEEEFDPFGEPVVPVGAKDLAAKIAANPELKALLDADPATRNTLYANARLAAETAEFKEVFANAEQARVAAAGNQEFSTLSDLVTSIDKPEDAQSFYAKLMELSVLHDDEGNPILQDGKPVSDGTVGRLIHHTGALFLNHFEQVAAASNDDELVAAVEILKARAFGGAASTNNEDLTEEQKARATELDTRENNLKAQEQAANAAKVKEYEDKITSGIDSHTDTAVSSLLARTDLAEGDRQATSAKIREAAYKLVADNPIFHREQDLLMRRQMGPKTQQERIALGKKWLQIALPIVAPGIIAEAGAKLIAKQGKQAAAQAAREANSRSEGAGALRTAKPVSAGSGQDAVKTATDALTTKLGRAPNSGELFAEIIRARS